ncbi:glycosyltransferase family 2 protein [Streptomyces sp. x-80]|uniref:glycosyltransferase family 2 protein n=1 Tax=Streptomyces sp. x-80 TaxID=2789282 RepID=UPI0039805BE1
MTEVTTAAVGADSAPHSEPDVSVVLAVYDGMPYLRRCLESIEAQTLAADRIEIIAVDDGSTDAGPGFLDHFAQYSRIPTRVLHQENSGGASRPRNAGLTLARGRYVFFMDADDYLGEEALERMVAMADRNETDVVLGKVIGVNRGAPRSMWGRNLNRADVFSSNIKFTLSAQKLFRRELLMRHEMRFDESLKTGEDALFTMEAYLRGNGVSVVADYTCYYLVGREDGKHLTKSGSYTLRFDSAQALMHLIAQFVPAGPHRDQLMIRPFLITLLPQFGPGLLTQNEEIQEHKLALARPLTDAYWTPGVAALLKVDERLRLHCVATERMDLLRDVLAFIKDKKRPAALLDSRRRTLFLAYPHFRDRSAGIPDTMYEVTAREALTSDTLRWAPRHPQWNRLCRTAFSTGRRAVRRYPILRRAIHRIPLAHRLPSAPSARR